MGIYDVSVLVLVYEQPKEKILLTLASVLKQTGVKIQIIIVDDGSRTSYLAEAEAFLHKYHFEAYQSIYQKKNAGTVKSCCCALEKAQGEYVKFISPGDCLASDEVLADWVQDIRNKRAKVSFCDSIYYRKGEVFECVVEVAHPQKPEVYSKRTSKQKRYCLLYDDVFLGASLISERLTTWNYMKMIENKVLYGEDNIYRLMIADRVDMTHFKENGIYYEWGSGVSTGKNTVYLKQLKTDWENTSKIISERRGSKIIDKMIGIYYMRDDERKSIWQKLVKFITDVEIELYHFVNQSHKKLTQTSDLKYLKALEEMVLWQER